MLSVHSEAAARKEKLMLPSPCRTSFLHQPKAPAVLRVSSGNENFDQWTFSTAVTLPDKIIYDAGSVYSQSKVKQPDAATQMKQQQQQQTQQQPQQLRTEGVPGKRQEATQPTSRLNCQDFTTINSRHSVCLNVDKGDR